MTRVAESLPSGDTVTIDDDGTRARIRKVVNGRERCSTMKALESLNLQGLLSHEKFVPECYLRASVADRLSLLRGLFDTDGYVTDPAGSSIEYSTTSPHLRDDVEFLVGSLGGRITWDDKPGRYKKGGVYHDAKLSYRGNVSFPSGLVPVSSEKHLAKWKPGTRRVTERFIRDVTPAGRAACRCIAVDAPDHLYVVDHFIVTHNTSFVLNVATNVASPRMVGKTQAGEDRYEPGFGVCVFSLEMPREQLAVRMTCSEARVDMGRVREGRLMPEDWRKLTESASYLSTLPVWIDDTPAISVLELRAKVRRVQAEYDREATEDKPARRVGMVMVDYLQLMKGRDGVHSREQEISEISRGLKGLAKELKVPVIALSQLNRAVETRSTKDKRPQLSDLRESGAIEQDADTIIFLYRPEYYDPETTDQKGIAELIIAKQRNGPTGKVKVRFSASCTRFDNLEPGDYPEMPDE